MHPRPRSLIAILLIISCVLSPAAMFTARGLAGDTPFSQETARIFLPLMIRGYSYRESTGMLDPELNGSGKVVTSFTKDYDIAYDIALQPDGKLLAVGEAYDLGFALARYNPDGTLDAYFGEDGQVTTNLGGTTVLIGYAANAVVLQRDSKILVAGRVYDGTGFDLGLARFNPDGSPDTSFGGGNGWVVSDFNAHNEEGLDLALQPDGKIVVTGYDYVKETGESDFLLVRYYSDGRLDTNFGEAGRVTTDFGSKVDTGNAVLLQVDGKILVAGGSAAGMALARYLPDGSLDPSFDLDGRVTLLIGGNTTEGSAIALTYDAKILVAGSNQFGSYDFALARFKADGSPDTSFGAGTGYVVTDFHVHNDFAHDLALQPDGKIVLAGLTSWEDNIFNSDFALARYHPDGSLDTSFGEDGRVTTDFGIWDYGHALVIQPDGKIVAVGQTPTGDYDVDFALARYR